MSEEASNEIRTVIIKDWCSGAISLNKACSLLYTLAFLEAVEI